MVHRARNPIELSVTEFYASDHITCGYGVGGHSGIDYGKMKRGTAIPSPATGKVAVKGIDKMYGHWVAIEIGADDYLGFAHMNAASPLVAKRQIALGQTLGTIGDSGDFAKGVHVHVYRGKYPHPWQRPTQDPMPTINAGVALSGATGKPINPTEPKGRKYMYRAALKDTQKVAYFDSVSFFETTNGSVDDNAWGRYVGKPGLVVTQAEWDSYKRVSSANITALSSAQSSLTTNQNDHLMSIATSAQLGVALTGTVNFVNEHADENKDAIIDAINSSSSLNGTYNITPAE